jgi:phthiocerol/phenolphthiocerol synthesis type-I polyketide synthase E
VTGNDIAIIGVAGRFPGAADVQELWRALRDGQEVITRFADDELARAGVGEAERRDPGYVPARGALADTGAFDADYFGMTPAEARLTDPQHRIFLETVVTAAEDAGYVLGDVPGPVGVFAAAPPSSYPVVHRPELLPPDADSLQVQVGNDADFLATRVAYKLDLRGPSVVVSTACSSGLVAVHLAVQSLLTGESGLAVAGAVSIRFPDDVGYRYSPASILSPDGHCRPFAADSAGTVEADGVAVVVLRELDAARAAGDHVYAVIKGSAIGNDGNAKIGYTAPGVQGQVTVLREALAVAGVAPRTVEYVEAHGTGTPLGDPVEARALELSYRADEDGSPLRVGSLKSNLGHLNHAAGVAGLIKAAFCLYHLRLVPSLHAAEVNPQIGASIKVQRADEPWPAGETPRRAGVSSFGMGGTNAHVVLEEPPAVPGPAEPDAAEVLMLSAATADALATTRQRLGLALSAKRPPPLADVAYTLRTGRRRFSPRAAVIATSATEAAQLLLDPASPRVLSATAPATAPPVALLLPGQGSQFPGMGLRFYQRDKIFRRHIDACADRLLPLCGRDLRAALQSADVDDPALTPAAVFAVSYAAARWWMDRGVTINALVGHSIGEYAAATLAGVFSLDDALALVVARGRLAAELPEGAMLAVAANESDTTEILAGYPELALCAVNAPDQCVVGGPPDAVAALRERLAADRVAARPLRVTRAFHTPMVESVLPRFAAVVGAIERRPPSIRYVSSVAGGGVTDEPTTVDYWVDHLRRPVRFAAALAHVRDWDEHVFVEAGPGRSLADLARRCGATATLPSLTENGDDLQPYHSLARLWLAGANVRGTRPGGRRAPLPGYPFARTRHWLGAVTRPAAATRRPLDDWFLTPAWRDEPLPPVDPVAALRRLPGRWLVFRDATGHIDPFVTALREAGREVVTVSAGTVFAPTGDLTYVIDPADEDGFQQLGKTMGTPPDRVVHAWGLDADSTVAPEDLLDRARLTAFWSIVWTARVFGATPGRRLDLRIVTRGLTPAGALAIGPLRVLGQEYPDITCGLIELDRRAVPGVARILAAESGIPGHGWVAHRDGRRRVHGFAALPLAGAALPEPAIRSGGSYLIIGGHGTVGRALALYLAREFGARIAIAARTTTDPQLVEAIAAAGGTAIEINGDVADPADARRMVDEPRSAFGGLDGVIHAAGAGGDVHPLLAEAVPADLDAHLRAKAHGLLVLEEVLARDPVPVDFVLVASSLAAVAGGLGFGPYAAANAFQDALAGAARGRARWCAVNLDGWSGGTAPAYRSGDRADRFAIAAEDADGLFDRLFRLLDHGQLYVSTSDLTARTAAPEPAGESEPVGEKPVTPVAPAHPRPPLATAYREPADDLERAVAGLWTDMLGIENVGADDNFFDLGGHSLIAMRLVARLGELVDLDVPLRLVFSAPTVAAMCVELERLYDTKEASR